jgi:hypothetical protein
MLAMIGSAMTNVMWAFVLLLVFTYMVSVMFMQVIVNKIDHVRTTNTHDWMSAVSSQTSEEWATKVRLSFGTVPSTMVTLIASISGGIDWIDAAWPLMAVNPAYLIVYCLFVMFCVFGLMNILTGIFVASTKDISKVDRDLVIRAQLQDRKSFANQLRENLQSADHDNTGTISKDELEQHLVSTDTQAYLTTLDVSVSDARGVFRLLDVTGSNEVSIDEFVLSLMRFQGGARAVDVATLLYEGKRNEARWNAYMDYIQEQFNALKLRLHVDERMTASLSSHVRKRSAESVRDIQGNLFVTKAKDSSESNFSKDNTRGSADNV